MQKILVFAVLMCMGAACALWTESSHGQSGGRDSAAGDNPSGSSSQRLPGVTPGREAQVITFVREHHGDLEPLLIYLKEHRPQEYEKAFRELFRTSERLAQIQERDEKLYELELDQWKVQSRIRLLVARMKMERDSEVESELRGELRSAVARQVELRKAILAHNRDRLAQRVEKLDQQIEQLEKNRQNEIDRQIKMLTGASEKEKPPASKSPVSTDSSPKKSPPKRTPDRRSGNGL